MEQVEPEVDEVGVVTRTRPEPAVPAQPPVADRRRGAGGRRRRSIPLVVIGALLVLGCGLAAEQVTARAGGRRPVLAAARDLPAGRALTAADVQVVRVAADPGVRLLPATGRQQLIGRTLALPQAAGSLLTPTAIGPARVPAAGLAVIGVAVKPGSYPPALQPGAAVRLVPTTATSPGATPPVTITGHNTGRNTDRGDPGSGDVSATVLSVSAPSGDDGSIVLGVQVPAGQADAVARSGELRVVSVGPGE